MVYFLRFGRLEKVQIVLDGHSGRSRGFGFIYYENHEDAREVRSQRFFFASSYIDAGGGMKTFFEFTTKKAVIWIRSDPHSFGAEDQDSESGSR